MNNTLYDTKPDWYFQSEGETDLLQDAWDEKFDPDNERGVEVIAHYHRNTSDLIRILGVQLTSSHGVEYADRAAIASNLGDEVDRVECIIERLISALSSAL